MLSDEFGFAGDADYGWGDEPLEPLASAFLVDTPDAVPAQAAAAPEVQCSPAQASCAPESTQHSAEHCAMVPVAGVPTVPTSHVLRLTGVGRKALRVENQLKLGLVLTRVVAPDAASASRTWRTVALPPELCTSPASPKTWAEHATSLRLTLGVFCASDPSHREVECCSACISREARSAERKRTKMAVKKEGAMSQTPSLEDSPACCPVSSSVVVFCCDPIRQLKDNQAVVPLRLRCYCSHHDERAGFCLRVALTDPATGEVVATAVSEPIMVRDDHKTGDRRKAKRQRLDTDDVLLSAEDDMASECPASAPSSSPTPLAAQPVAVAEPKLFKLAPASGPVAGGITIMAAGCDLSAGQRLHFGPYIATDTQSWGNGGTLMCTLPPATQEGTVLVTVDGRVSSDNSNPTFTYKDDSDMKLFALALQLVGMKLTGRVDNPRQVALSIVQSTRTSSVTQQQPGSNSGGNTGYQLPIESLLLRALSVAQRTRTNFEMNLLLQDGETERTILHYAAIRGYTSLATWLARQGGQDLINASDCAGFTALHYTAFYGHMQLAELLLSMGASTLIPTDDGRFPCDLASNPQLHAFLNAIPETPRSDQPQQRLHKPVLGPAPPSQPSSQPSSQGSTPPESQPPTPPHMESDMQHLLPIPPKIVVDTTSSSCSDDSQSTSSSGTVITVRPQMSWGLTCRNRDMSWWARNSVLVVGLVMVLVIVSVGCLTSPGLLKEPTTQQSDKTQQVEQNGLRTTGFYVVRSLFVASLTVAALLCAFGYMSGGRSRHLLVFSLTFFCIDTVEIARFFLVS
eukprot:m51a1_g2640 hypothetical protein (800) ;mRNA; r:590130-593315